MKRNLDQLKDRPFDLLILGGGITGAGIALDATLRGWRVALIDKGDFASGTSSISSKLIHGGLRYLEHGQFRLVYEALHERRRLLNNAPHLVWPLRFVVPVHRDSRVPQWKLRLGLMMYDLLAGRENLRRSGPLRRSQILHEVPNLRGGGLLCGADYFDAQMDDARLCIEVIKTAANHEACVANYAEALAFEKKEGRITAVRVRDLVGDDEFTIQAAQFVNATGPWVDEVCKLAGDPDTPHLQPTKGIHLILPDQGFRSAFLLTHPRDGRVFFVIPWLGKTLVGTTDTECDDSPDQVTATDEDISYLLDAYNHYFRDTMGRADILNTFAGLRPLMRQKPGDPSSLSREFHLYRSASGLFSVVGGKYTTYRRMAEVIVDEIGRAGGVNRRRSRTRDFKLDGAPQEDWESFQANAFQELHDGSRLPESVARHLINRYGRRAYDLEDVVWMNPTSTRPIIAGEPDIEAELAYQREHEMAVFPADHLLRRTRLGLFHPELLRRNLG